MSSSQGRPRQVIRTLFLSDVHLGCRHSQAEALLTFLDRVQPERMYVVGDLIDGWQLQRRFRWRPEYSRVLSRLTEMTRAGTEIFYIPGNHDEFVRRHPLLRNWLTTLGVTAVADEFVMETADRRRFLVTHGDQFDLVEQSAQWLSQGVTGIYETALSLNWCMSRLLRTSDVSPYWLCAIAKNRVKAAIRFFSAFESAVLRYARSRGCDGVICGHLHTPAIFERDGLTYCNTGDWVENCTALVETADGSLTLAYHYASPVG
jgi:UDP-2,3-diacylglucosamine pyrophosphatase LpxH